MKCLKTSEPTGGSRVPIMTYNCDKNVLFLLLFLLFAEENAKIRPVRESIPTQKQISLKYQ